MHVGVQYYRYPYRNCFGLGRPILSIAAEIFMIQHVFCIRLFFKSKSTEEYDYATLFISDIGLGHVLSTVCTVAHVSTSYAYKQLNKYTYILDMHMYWHVDACTRV